MSERFAGDLAIVTMTLVRDPSEEPLLRRSILALARFGLPVFVSDGGSGRAFTSFLTAVPNVHAAAPAGTGLVAQVRASLASAIRTGARFVFYTEPDKEEFFESSLTSFLERFTADADAGVMLAGRSSRALETYPPIQQFTEGTINDLCRRFFDIAGDYSYGPFVLHSDVARYAHRASDDLGWGWRHFIFAIAHRLGHPLVHVAGDHLCPEDQSVEDDRERLHRIRQLAQNVRGLEAGLSLNLQLPTTNLQGL